MPGEMQYNPYSYNPYYAPMPFNPMQAYQQRLQNMEQAYPHLAQQQAQMQQPMQPGAPMPMQPQQTPPLKGRAVTGVEEARAAQIDFDGSIHVFTDTANGRIYTKQLGLNGQAVFNTYALQEAPAQPEPAQTEKNPGVSVDALMGRIGALEARVNKYEEMIGNVVQPNANNGNAAKQRKPDATAAGAGGE